MKPTPQELQEVAEAIHQWERLGGTAKESAKAIYPIVARQIAARLREMPENWSPHQAADELEAE